MTNSPELSFVNYKNVTVVVLKNICNVKESAVAAQPNEKPGKVGNQETKNVIN